VEHDTGIQRARPRSHDKPVERAEAHRAVDAAPVVKRAQADAAAEMADDHPAFGNFRRNLGQNSGNVLIRQTMKAVTPDAFVVIGARQREQVGHFRVIPVKSRVEARNLRDLWIHGPRRFDVIQVVRQMQRCERT
jgi:hypothetical protein